MNEVVQYRVDIKAFDALSSAELYAVLKMRVDVFVVEQNCPYPELDGRDPEALHLRLLDGDELLATTRLFGPDVDDGAASIGRVAVSPAHRGKRLGDILMRESVAACERLFAGHPIKLAAQSHLRRFYESFGFVVISDEYDEDGIPHLDMLRQPASQQ